MIVFLARRIAYAALVIVAATFVVAMMVRLVPGDPVEVMAAGNPGMMPEQMDELRHELGVDKPLLTAFADYALGAMHGDLGTSFRQQAPAAELVMQRLPATAELSFWAMLLALSLAIPIGVFSALRRGRGADMAATTLAVLGVSTPGFLLGILLILAFSVRLRWLPSSGYRGSALGAIVSSLAVGDLAGLPAAFWTKFRYFLLPTVSLGFALMAVNARLTRSAMIDAMGRDYVRFARAKGLPPRAVVLGHALRNAILPVVTVIGLQLGMLLSGAIVVETVFAWPGIGRLAVQAIQWRDYALVQAVVLVSAVVFVVASLAVDLLYRLIDPRLRHH